MFDRVPETLDSSQLTFEKDDILYIDNTMYNGVPGHWSAWLVDNEGNRTRWGIIPSKYKVRTFGLKILLYEFRQALDKVERVKDLGLVAR